MYWFPALNGIFDKESKTSENKLDFKEHQQIISNPSVTTAYSVGSNHDIKLLYKKWSQKVKPFWRYFMFKNQTTWLTKRILGAKLKKWAVKLLQVT